MRFLKSFNKRILSILCTHFNLNIAQIPTKPYNTQFDFSMAYTPGVAFRKAQSTGKMKGLEF